MSLRAYQQDIFKNVTAGTLNDLVQLDTGAGKTPIMAALAKWSGACICIAHRNVLVEQLSEQLARAGVEHDVIGSAYTRNRCAARHAQFGACYVRKGARTLVASIDSLVSRHKRGLLGIDTAAPWLVVIDEAHHVVPDNKWGQLRAILPCARIVGFTGTPARLDGQALGASQGGLFDRLVQASSLADNSTATLIGSGYLSAFAVYAPAQRLAHGAGHVEWADDPVKWYNKLCPGARAVVMCPTIDLAGQVARTFSKRGISAGVISSRMGKTDVSRTLDAFYAGRIRVLTNVDMVTEGFDMPDADALIMLRATASFVAYRQWCGRVLRPRPGKTAIIIDMVGNTMTHGMPDDPVKWSIDCPPKGLDRLRTAPCTACGLMYFVGHAKCPECEEPNVLLQRGGVSAAKYDVRRLDLGLIEQARRGVLADELAARKSTEIVWPTYPGQGTMVGDAVGMVRKWFVDALIQANVAYADINAFLESGEAKDQAYWTARYTVLDTRDKAPTKPLKEFTKWLKSR